VFLKNIFKKIVASKVLLQSILLFVYSLNFQAQTGPGGVGTSANNVLWLSADNQVYNNAGTTLASNNDNVQQWNDRSGNTKNASQAVAGNRPNYITNVINGLPIIRYSAGNDHLMSTAVTTANVASVWAVAAYASLPSSNPGILIGAPAGTGTNVGAGSKSIGMWVSSGGGTQVWGRGIQSNGTSRDISQVTSLSTSTFYIINNICRAATSINQFVNNAAAGNNNSHNGTLSSWTDVTIGRQGTESWSGDIAEVIFYNIEVNSAQRIIVDNYLAAKYGLTLTSNDLYNKDNAGNGNFDFEVAGIGRVDASNIHSSAQGSGIVRVTNPSGLGNDEFLFWGHNNLSTQATELSDVPTGVQGRMARVWRVSEVNAASSAVDVGSIDIQFDLTGLGSITASDLRLLVDTDNDGVFTDETAISGASFVSGNIYQFAGVTAITNNVRFSLGTINKIQTPLPIELIDFKAQLLPNNQVLLEWNTATEKNNAEFEVEKSENGTQWQVLNSIKGNENSNTLKHYEILDTSPFKTITYYRLKQIDFSGVYKYYNTVAIQIFDSQTTQLSVYPNPSSGRIYIEASLFESDEIQLFNEMGKLILDAHIERKLINNKAVYFINQLNSGVYFVKSKTQTIKLIVL